MYASFIYRAPRARFSALVFIESGQATAQPSSLSSSLSFIFVLASRLLPSRFSRFSAWRFRFHDRASPRVEARAPSERERTLNWLAANTICSPLRSIIVSCITTFAARRRSACRSRPARPRQQQRHKRERRCTSCSSNVWHARRIIAAGEPRAFSKVRPEKPTRK